MNVHMHAIRLLSKFHEYVQSLIIFGIIYSSYINSLFEQLIFHSQSDLIFICNIIYIIIIYVYIAGYYTLSI